MARLIERELSYQIVSGMYEVHGDLGFGFVEPIYSRCLDKVLRRKGLHVERELRMPVMFQGEQVGVQRVDMLVNGRVIVEIKSTERLADAAFRQLRSYLTGMSIDLGLILHFGPSARFYRVLRGYPTRTARRHPSGISGNSGNPGNSVAPVALGPTPAPPMA